MSHRLTHPLLLATLALSTAQALAQSSYQFTELKPLAADATKNVRLTPRAINDQGQVVGRVYKQTGYRFSVVGFRYEPEYNEVPTAWSATGVATEVKRPSLPYGANRYSFNLLGLNNQGQWVGSAASKVIQSPVIWKQGTPSFISALTGQAFAINDAGMIVGEVLANQQDGSTKTRADRTQAALWRSGALQNLHAVVNGVVNLPYSRATDVDAGGRILIEAFTQSSDDKACVMIQQGTATVLPTPAGYSCSAPAFWGGTHIRAELRKRCLAAPCEGDFRRGWWLQGQPVAEPALSEWIKAPVTGLPSGFTVGEIVDVSATGRMLVVLNGPMVNAASPSRWGTLTPKP